MSIALSPDPAPCPVGVVPPLCPLAAQAPADAELSAWLRLVLQPGLTPAVARRLLQQAGSAVAVFERPATSWHDTLEPGLAAAVAAPATAAVAAAIAAVQRWAEQPGHRVLVYAEPDYPAGLRDLHDPPLVLYVRGRVAQLQRPGVALVGARLASPAGCELAQVFGHELAAAGWSVVSGLARGIDAAAHEGALRAAGGAGTLAVMATGIDRIYPRQNLALAQRIVTEGAVVSELPLGTPSAAFQFPRRNRLVAALSRGIVVLEAAARSGSLITARLAGELGRDVFAVPGSVHSALSRGCHALIREGAYLTESSADVLGVLAGSPQLPLAACAPAPLSDAGAVGPPAVPAAESWVSAAVIRAVLHALGHDPTPLDAVLRRTGLPSPVVQTGLLALELELRARRLDDGRWERVTGARP